MDNPKNREEAIQRLHDYISMMNMYKIVGYTFTLHTHKKVTIEIETENSLLEECPSCGRINGSRGVHDCANRESV